MTSHDNPMTNQHAAEPVWKDVEPDKGCDN
jgi:hypothetical protein